VQCAAFSDHRSAQWQRTVAAAGKIVQLPFGPRAVVLRCLVDSAVARPAADLGCTEQIALRIQYRALRGIHVTSSFETKNDGFRPCAVSTGSQLEDIAGDAVGTAARAIEISLSIEYQTWHGQRAVA